MPVVELKDGVPTEVLDLSVVDVESLQIDAKYCVTEDAHDNNVAKTLRRHLPPVQAKMDGVWYDPVAIVCSGPSLTNELGEIRKFSKILTCSGAHDFLIQNGIVPTWHMEADPRQHKCTFVKHPHHDVQYLIASCCHSAVFDSLTEHDVRIWHVLAGERSRPVIAAYPRDHWMVTGGSNVGMRALVLARLLGYVNQHVFGMDCSADERAFHVGDHPNEPKREKWFQVAVGGRKYHTSQVFLHYAKQFFTETQKLSDVQVTLHGDGLLQALASWKMSDPEQVTKRMRSTEPATTIALMNPATISESYRVLNRQMHEQQFDFGSLGVRHADVVADLYKAIKADSCLDYGAGKQTLAAKLPFPIWSYDPCVPGIDAVPRPADLVVCCDVLEHVEPEYLETTLRDLARCILKVGYFVINTSAAGKVLPDGRNTHLIQQPMAWWEGQLKKYFEVGKIFERGRLLYAIVGPQKRPTAVQPFVSQERKNVRRWHVLEGLVKEHGWKRGVEVGVKAGFTFLHLLETCPELDLTGVDIFEPRPGLEAEGGESHVSSNLPAHEARIRIAIEQQYAGRARLIKALSVEAAKQIPDGSLDFAFIDADHREQPFRDDVAAWLPKIRKGGMLTGHDAQDKFPGVLAAINDLCPGWKLYPDSVWVWQC